MIGDTIHLIFCQILKAGELQLQSLHATFEGARRVLLCRKEYWKGRGFDIWEGSNGSFSVIKDDEELRYYFVSSRTIDR